MLKATGEDTIICVFNVKYQWFFILQQSTRIRKTTWGKRQKVASEQIVADKECVTQLTPQLISFRKEKMIVAKLLLRRHMRQWSDENDPPSLYERL